MKALIVDDSGVMRRIVAGALAKGDITDVAQAADGVEAVVAATSQQFDVILMDWNMPNLNGLDALRQIRSQGVTTPVIMVTTEAERSRVLDAVKAGASNYVVKPFTPETILEKIHAVCGVTAG